MAEETTDGMEIIVEDTNIRIQRIKGIKEEQNADMLPVRQILSRAGLVLLWTFKIVYEVIRNGD